MACDPINFYWLLGSVENKNACDLKGLCVFETQAKMCIVGNECMPSVSEVIEAYIHSF